MKIEIQLSGFGVRLSGGGGGGGGGGWVVGWVGGSNGGAVESSDCWSELE